MELEKTHYIVAFILCASLCLIFSLVLIYHVFIKDRKKSNKVTLNTPSSPNALDDTYLFDFLNYSSQYNGIGNVNSIMVGGSNVMQDARLMTPEEVAMGANPLIGQPNNNNKNASTKIALTPKKALIELETVPTPFDLLLLDEKISMLKDKSKLITQLYAKREVNALIERIENRKKYNQFKPFFESYQNTTDEKIDLFLKKHDHLVMKTSDIFIPEFPDDAIKTMNAYTENLNKICGKKPVFYVIAEKKDFKEAYKKRDPILLVQSPFGFYWQILGAWDEEMLLLHEL